MSYSNLAENAINEAICNNTPLAVAQLYLKLHVGDPGEDCTANPAVETTRKSVSFGASAAGTALNDALVGPWTNVAATEVYSHASLWDAAVAGNPWMYGALTIAKSIGAGDSFDFAVGEVAFISS